MRLIRAFTALACFLPLVSASGQIPPPPPWTVGPYAYDHAGNIRTIGTSVFVYDIENRLLHEKIGTQKPQVLTYDGFGNIRTIAEGSKLQTVGVTSGTNRADVASTALNHMYGTYDRAGNMVTTVTTTDTATPRTHTYTYDALNVMTKSATDASRAYVYNANDERIGVITVAANGSEISSQWTLRDPGGQVLRRFSREGGQWRWMQDYVYRDGKMLASESNDQLKTLHYHLDHLGTPRLITGNGGTEVARHTYYPFGEEAPGTTPQVAEPKKFTGHERDSGGIDYMHARYYDYSMGRFLSVDPVLNVKRHAQKPQGWNRYSYVENNPTNSTDPTGRCTVESGLLMTCVEVWQAAVEGFKNAAANSGIGKILRGAETGDMELAAEGQVQLNYEIVTQFMVASMIPSGRSQTVNTAQRGEAWMTAEAFGAMLGSRLAGQTSGKMAAIATDITSARMSQVNAAAAVNSAVQATGLRTTGVMKVGKDLVVGSVAPGTNRAVIVIDTRGVVRQATATIEVTRTDLVIKNIQYQ